MKLIYTDSNRFLVSNAKNIVENAGIAVSLKNEYAAGGAGELSAIDSWLELWVVNDKDCEKATRLLASTQECSEKDWVCTGCNESNSGAFEICWNCLLPSP